MTSENFLRQLFLPVYLPSLFYVLVNMACVILLPLYLLEQGAGVAVASLAATMRGVGILLVDLPAGIIANRIGDKPVMMLGVTIALLAILLLAGSGSVSSVLLASFLLGGSNGLYIQGRLSYINDVSRPDQRARALSIIAAAQRFGSLIAPLVFSLFAQQLGYQPVFLVMAVLLLLNLGLVLFCAKNIPAPHRREARIRDMFTMAWDLRRVFLTAGMSGVALMALRAGRQILFPIAGYGIGLDAVEISSLYSVSMLVDLSLSYPAAMIMDRYGRKISAVPGMAILSGSIIAVTLVPGLWGMVLFAVLSGIGNGLTTGILLTFASDYAPEAQRNQFIGIWRTQSDLGLLGAPLVIGAMAETAGLAAAAVVVAAVGFAGTGILAYAVGETLAKSVPGD